jgi:Tfp pilus assembly protein PilF
MYYSEREIDIDEQDPAYWANMAFSLQRDDKPEKAEKYYKKALELDPVSYQSWVRFE